MKRVTIYISGRVQGVFYRANFRKEAQKLGIKGYVKNLPDGRVEAVVEGEDSPIFQIIEWCKVGPNYAKVENFETIEEKYRGEFKNFSIL